MGGTCVWLLGERVWVMYGGGLECELKWTLVSGSMSKIQV